MPNPVKMILIKALEILRSGPNKWTRGTFARFIPGEILKNNQYSITPSGSAAIEYVARNPEEICKFGYCAEGAIMLAARLLELRAYEYGAYNTMARILNLPYGIPFFNDKQVQKEAVEAAFEKTIAGIED